MAEFAGLSAASLYSKASSKPGEAYPASHHKRLRQEDPAVQNETGRILAEFKVSKVSAVAEPTMGTA